MEYKSLFPLSTTTGTPMPGKMLLFQYGAKTAERLPFYDRQPLVVVTAVQGNAFWGVNLHYTKPSNRKGILRYIDSGDDLRIVRGYHKYLKSYVDSLFLDINMNEWDKAIEQPIQDFVRDLGSINLSVSNSRIYK